MGLEDDGRNQCRWRGEEMICEAFGINLGYWMIFFGIGTLIGLIIINILLTKLNNALHEKSEVQE